MPRTDDRTIQPWLLLLLAALALVAAISMGTADAIGPSINGTGGWSSGAFFGQLASSYAFVADDVTIGYASLSNSVSQQQGYWTDYLVAEYPVPDITAETFGITQLPIAGETVVMVYNLPMFNASDPQLVVDRETLAAIWEGNVSMWDDASIKALNPTLASRLPTQPIRLGYFDDTGVSISQLVKTSLSSFSATFDAALKAAGGKFANLTFALEGRGQRLDDSAAHRMAWLSNTSYAMTYAEIVAAPPANGTESAPGVRYMNMYNKAGNLVQPSIDTAQSAMRDFTNAYAAENLTVHIIDAPGNQSWPMTCVFFIALSNAFKMSDCTRVSNLMNFIAWVVVNDGVASVMSQIGLAPLDNTIKKHVIDRLNTIKCNGAVAYPTRFLVGYGAPLLVMNQLVNLWTSATTTGKYYDTTSSEAAALQIDYGGDFGATILGVAASDMAQMPDAGVMPLAAFAMVPAYNVPELLTGAPTFALDYDTLAGIYLGTVVNWNDTRIRATNTPDVCARLPNATIRVIVQDADSDFNQLLTQFLSAQVPAFAAAVGVSRRPTFGGLIAHGSVVYSDGDFGVGSVISTVSHAFALWPQYGVDLTVRVPSALSAALVPAAGGGPVIASAATLQAAVDSFVASGGRPASATVVIPNNDVSPLESSPARSLDTRARAGRRPSRWLWDATTTTTTTGSDAGESDDPNDDDNEIQETKRAGSTVQPWPIVAFINVIYRQTGVPDCNKAAALADFLYWSQTNSLAVEAAQRQGYIVAASNPALYAQGLNILAAYTCGGSPVSALAACITNGTICTNQGTCNGPNNTCLCNGGRKGAYCQLTDASGSSTDTVLIAVLSVVLPLAAFLLVCLCLVAAFVYWSTARRRRDAYDWEITIDEIEMGDQLGQGGFGQVHKAMWKGTEVAVKVMISDKITKETGRVFKEEVLIMTALRHPNVVLFMAACTKPPNMCIVMEYMALGSLFDLLHNELVPEIPFGLVAKMAYQTAKGMHFLHSSGIVHRDLKSLNLLLDNKWNVKVSDFGLTKFKADLGNGGGGGTGTAATGGAANGPVGSIHWMAPEILQEQTDVDHILADVYSFGIILCEMLTREQPYYGLSPAAVAVAVIRDNVRPRTPAPEKMPHFPMDYFDLMTSCWHVDPTIRPTFLEVMTRLCTMSGDASSGFGPGGFTSTSSSSSSASASVMSAASTAPSSVTFVSTDERKRPTRRAPKRSPFDSLTSLEGDQETTASPRSRRGMHRSSVQYDDDDGDSGSGDDDDDGENGGVRGRRNDGTSTLFDGARDALLPNADSVAAPQGQVTIVFTDITRAASLWDYHPVAMCDATILHNAIVREALKRHHGYETAFARDRNSGEGSFCVVFQEITNALAWCCDVQKALLAADWPEALLAHPGAQEQRSDVDDSVVLYRGLRVRMGVNVGVARTARDPVTRRAQYTGPNVDLAGRITAMTHGGQIILSHDALVHLETCAPASLPSHGQDPRASARRRKKWWIAPGRADADNGQRADARLWSNVQRLGCFAVRGVADPCDLYEARIVGLEGRFFGGIDSVDAHLGDTSDSSSALPKTDRPADCGFSSSARDVRQWSSKEMDHGSARAQQDGSSYESTGGDDDNDGDNGTHGGGGKRIVQTMIGDGIESNEDTMLTSANLCRWIIPFDDIKLGDQVGLGSYGVVYKGHWKGVQVAVKRIIRQKLDEKRILEFRAEMAIMSNLNHPNVITFIGACVQRPNLCIVTEFMPRGNLRDVLADSSLRLSWVQRMTMLHTAAQGVNYLHTLKPTAILHRDLKPSNLLVDENMHTVKVADFGFARIKEDNATMTRCGTPCWTAPEILRGEHYNEKADVYSFGIIIWQVLTRKEPFANRNFIGVSLDVLEGRRPQIPSDWPDDIRRLVKRCWHARVSKRPTMADVVTALVPHAGNDGFSPASAVPIDSVPV